MQGVLGLVRQEADVREIAPGHFRFEPRAPGAVSDDRNRQALFRPQQIRGRDQDVEILRHPDVARVHHDEPIDEAHRARERIVLGPGPDQLAVSPVVDDVHARRIGTLLGDEAFPHAIPEGDDRVGFAREGID